MRIVDSRAMAEIDSTAQLEYSIPASILMENAGIKTYLFCRERFGEFADGLSYVLFVAGGGNNGGDAFVMARQAYLDGVDVRVLLAAEIRGETSRTNLEILRALSITVVSWLDDVDGGRDALAGAGLIVDGLFGTGISGPLRENVAELTAAINQSEALVVAIDLPSGIFDGYRKGYPAVRADVTVCLGLPKRCLYLPEARVLCGEIVHLPIGFPPALLAETGSLGELLSEDDIVTLRPEIPANAYKSSRGRLAVFAGSSGTTGAAILSATSAARSRCGLVYLHVDEEVYSSVASAVVSVMARPWTPGADAAGYDFSGYDAYLAGPGWGFAGRLAWLEALILSGLPGVLDADALTLLPKMSTKPDLGGKVVLTPHPGEMAGLTGLSIGEIMQDPFRAALETSAAYNAVVTLKGHITVIAEPDGRCSVVDGMAPALGTGGSGDVLAGIIAGVLAGGADAGLAAKLGVLIHLKAAKTAFSEDGWFLAEDLLPHISRIFAEVK